MKLETARQYATEIVDILRPYCDRIEIAGGIRREKPEPHDIEIVVKPKFVDATYGLYQPLMENSFDTYLRQVVLHDGGWVGKEFNYGEPDKAGKKAPCGPKYYRLKYRGEKLDIFAVIPPAEWGCIFAIRTGDADYSHWLVQQGWPKGMKVIDGHLERNGIKVITPEESDFFETLGVKMPEPRFRDYRGTRAEPIPSDPLYQRLKS